MISASRSYRHPGRPRPMVSGGDVPYLHVVDDDVYGDWESVYRDNVDRLYRLMYSRVGNRADAEDLTSEVFSTALRPLRLSASKGTGARLPARDGQNGACLVLASSPRPAGHGDRPRHRHR